MRDLIKKNIKIILICFMLFVIIASIMEFIAYKKSNIETYTEINSVNQIEETNKEETIVVILNSEDEEENNTIENNDEEIIKVENKKQENQKNDSEKISSNKYYIKVNYGANVVTVYTKDNDGNYNKPVKAMVCSTGQATPKSGKYSIKLRWEWLGLFRRCIWTFLYTN